jgi:Rieske Fe-S protein
VVLAGCGNTGTASLPARTDNGGEPAAVSSGEAIAAADEVEPNSAVPFTNAETGAPEVLIRLQDEELVAYSAVCTHQGCIVSYQPQTQKLACPCHGGVFDPAEGAAVVSGPPPTPLPEVAFEVREGKVFLA